MTIDVFILATNSASYVAPAGPPLGVTTAIAVWRGYARAKRLERNVLGWTAFCLLLGLPALLVFWLLTRREEKRWAFESVPKNRRTGTPPSSLPPTWEPNWDAVSPPSAASHEVAAPDVSKVAP